MSEPMSDTDLADYLCPDDRALGLRFVDSLTPAKRAVFDRMWEVEGEIMLWQGGVGKKPEGVILCGRKEIKGVGWGNE